MVPKIARPGPSGLGEPVPALAEGYLNSVRYWFVCFHVVMNAR